MATIPANSRVKQVRMIAPDGSVYATNVIISPDAKDVFIYQPDATGENTNGTQASLQDFLFRRFEIKDNQWIATDKYYSIDPSNNSLWQNWVDYQDITQQRLVGLYGTIEKEDGTVEIIKENFLTATEEGVQAEHALHTAPIKNEQVEKNWQAVKTIYGLKEDKKITMIPDAFDENGKVKEDCCQAYSAEQQAKELMLSFQNQSFWQAMIDKQLEMKDKLIGIYDSDGKRVGYFEATANNLNALKDVYEKGFSVCINDDGNQNVTTITWGAIKTDKDAMDLLIDVSKKSVYQQLLELKDFWITLPFESYDAGNDSENKPIMGLNIVNKNDIATFHLCEMIATQEIKEEIE